MLGLHGLHPYHAYSSATPITQGAAYHYSLEHRSGYREALPRRYGMRWHHATPHSLLLAIEFLRLFVQCGVLLEIRFRQPRLRLGLATAEHGTLCTLAFCHDALLHRPTAHTLHRCPHRFRHDVSEKGAGSNHDC